MADQELPVPSLRYGLLCERALIEQDNIISFIRVIDRININAQGTGLPTQMPEVPVSFTIAWSWVGGLGNYRTRVVITGPGEARFEFPETSFYLSSLDGGQNTVVTAQFPVKTPGMYWVTFELNGESRSRIPLLIVYNPTQLPGQR